MDRSIAFFIFLFCGATALAQPLMPLEETIKMQITSRDTDLLSAYNIYSFDHTAKDGDKFSANFLILKEHDTISRKSYILGQLTLVKEFILFQGKAGGKPALLQVEDGIEVRPHRGINKQVYLNFDPTFPDPVFILKQVIREHTP